MAPVVLQALPSEILEKIIRNLPKRALFSASKVSMRMRMATLPFIFSSIRINVNERDWAIVAMASVHADTFKLVKELELKIKFQHTTEEINADELRLQISNSDAGHAFFKLLSLLSVLKIEFDVNFLDDFGCRDYFRGAAWEFLETLCGVLLRATNFNLHFRCTSKLAWSDAIWGELSQPFQRYLGATVRIDDFHSAIVDATLGTPVASAFSPTWVSHLHLAILGVAELRLAAGFANLTHLTVSGEESSDWCIAFWECLRNLQACLIFLSVRHIGPDLSRLAPKTPILLSSLTALEFIDSHPAYINHFCTQIQTPLLRSLNATIDLPGGPEMIEQLYNLDRSLRSQCPRRHYDIVIQDNNTLWQQDLKHLASQASRDPTFADTFTLSLSLRSHYTSEEIEEEELRANAQNGTLAVLQGIPAVCRPLLEKIQYSIETDCFSNGANSGRIYLDNLAHLALTVACDNDYPDLQAYRFSSMIVVPKLECLEIRIDGNDNVGSGEGICLLLVPSVSQWLCLKKVSLLIAVKEEEHLLETGSFKALQSTCKANDVSLVIYGIYGNFDNE